MTPCPAHIARHTIRKGFAPDAPANAADRRTYSSALPAGAVTPQRRAWQSSLLHDARHSRAFFMPGRSAQLLAAVPRVPGRQHRTETTRRRAAAVASITPQTGQQSAAIHRNPPPPARPEAKAGEVRGAGAAPPRGVASAGPRPAGVGGHYNTDPEPPKSVPFPPTSMGESKISIFDSLTAFGGWLGMRGCRGGRERRGGAQARPETPAGQWTRAATPSWLRIVLPFSLGTMFIAARKRTRIAGAGAEAAQRPQRRAGRQLRCAVPPGCAVD